MPGLLLPTLPCDRDQITYSKPASTTTSKFTCSSQNQKHQPTPSTKQSIHFRRTLSHSRRPSSPPPPSLSGLGIDLFSNTETSRKDVRRGKEIEVHVIEITSPGISEHEEEEVEKGLETQIPSDEDSDQEVWEKMLGLQRRFHCYTSARLDAGVAALEMGWGVEGMSIPSRSCLNLLNKELREKFKGW